MRIFLECDAHPATGGPHVSRGLYVGRYFDHPADVVMCTYRSKKGKVCGALILVPHDREEDRVIVPGTSGFKTGDRVRLTTSRNFYDDVIPADSLGIVLDASTVSHATANGGGFDVRVWWDEFVGYDKRREEFTDKVVVNSNDLALILI